MTDAAEEQADAMMRFGQEIAAGILSLPELSGADWVSYAMAADVDERRLAVTAFRYAASGEAIATEGPENDDVLWELQDAMAGPDGPTWGVAIVQLERGSGRLAVRFLSGAEAERFRVEPGTMDEIAEELRPAPEDFAD